MMRIIYGRLIEAIFCVLYLPIDIVFGGFDPWATSQSNLARKLILLAAWFLLLVYGAFKARRTPAESAFLIANMIAFWVILIGEVEISRTRRQP